MAGIFRDVHSLMVCFLRFVSFLYMLARDFPCGVAYLGRKDRENMGSLCKRHICINYILCVITGSGVRIHFTILVIPNHWIPFPG